MVQAARDVNLQVRRGETLGVVGESGSGKSTVARCIARLIEPTTGAILIEGADVAKLGPRALRPHRKRVQIGFQDSPKSARFSLPLALYPARTPPHGSLPRPSLVTSSVMGRVVPRSWFYNAVITGTRAE